MNEPSQLSHFPEAQEKNESQPCCYGRRGGICRENGLGSRSLANMPSQDTVIQFTPCLATHLTSRPNCQTCRPGHRGSHPMKPGATSAPFISLVPWQPPPHTHKTRAPLLTGTVKSGKGHPQPFMGNSDLNLPNKTQGHMQFSRNSTLAKRDLFTCPTPTDAQRARHRHSSRPQGDRHEQSTQEPLALMGYRNIPHF